MTSMIARENGHNVVKEARQDLARIRQLHYLLGQVYETAAAINRESLAVLYDGIEEGEAQATKAIATATLMSEVCGSLLEHDFAALGVKGLQWEDIKVGDVLFDGKTDMLVTHIPSHRLHVEGIGFFWGHETISRSIFDAKEYTLRSWDMSSYQ